MCVALPGTVLSTDGKNAVVDFNGNHVNARAGLVNCRPGDAVLVHAGIILQKLAPGEADAMQELFQELAEFAPGKTN